MYLGRPDHHCKLRCKVFCIQLLRWLKLIPDVWYESEIELSWLKAKEMHKYFFGEQSDIEEKGKGNNTTKEV